MARSVDCPRSFGLALAGIALLASCSLPVDAPKSIRLLAIGQVMPRESPIDTWFSADPLVQYTLVPTDIDPWFGLNPAAKTPEETEETWRRFVRIYFPKSREALRNGFDFFVFPDAYLEPFSLTQLADMKYAIENGTGSLVTFGGDVSTPTYKSWPGWANSVLGETLPVKMTLDMIAVGGVFYVRVVKTDPPVLSMFLPLGLEKWVGGVGFSHLHPKEGAEVWAKVKSDRLKSVDPGNFLVSWRYGSGVSWAVADDMDHLWWSGLFYPSEHNNEYAEDVFLNIVFYSIGWDLPKDVVLVHRVRTRYFQYNQRKLLLYVLLDFVDSFGANTRDIERQIAEVESLKAKSFDMYSEMDYEQALTFIDEAIAGIESAETNAMRLREKAFFWVYLTEWSAVTGAFCSSGLVVYSLLVRRMLYREVAVTRSRAGERQS